MRLLFTWLNEFTDEKLDEDSFKTFVEGTIDTVKLYRDGSFKITHKLLIIGTANNLPKVT